MALFKRNPNEVDYPNGKKPFMSVIKYEGSNEFVIWKVPYEDFNSHSKVIVPESMDALFYKNGVVEEVLSAGSYDLSTGNYPFLSRIRNSLTDGVSVYNCQIYFVNKADQMEIKWGTPSPVTVTDINFANIPTEISANGAYTLQVVDSKKFFVKMVGMNAGSLTAKDVNAKIRSPVNEAVTRDLATILMSVAEKTGLEMLQLASTRISEVSKSVQESLEPLLESYGIRLVRFNINPMEIQDTPERREVLKRRGQNAGYAQFSHETWDRHLQERTQDAVNSAAKNEGSIGGLMGAGLGLGMGLGMGNAMQGMATGSVNNATGAQKSSILCPNCGAPNPVASKFCGGCGAPMAPAGSPAVCPACGASNPSGSKFCSGCGKPLPTGTATKPCPKCGAPNPSTAKFCSGCGSPMTLTCPACGAPLTPGAKFCSGCGGSLP